MTIPQQSIPRLKTKPPQSKRTEKMTNKFNFENAINDYKTLGLPHDLAVKLAEIERKERSIPYYERSEEDKKLVAEAYNIMAQKSVIPTTTPFINY